ncbi:hypothetical protein [Thalassovita taeanensis]|uniref:hypothetical protein n=1 Tax=Thalassovita taeanensis TaxID=657014 RepID=UPI001114A8CE|nr:hypothetical protein [Thalassovita taeanensis]
MNRDADESKEDFFCEALRRYGVEPISTDRSTLLDFRLVQDLGIAGDDFEDFFEIINSMRPVSGKLPRRFIPSELGSDAYHVAQATGWLSKKIPWLKRWHISRIKCPSITLRELFAVLYEGDPAPGSGQRE